MSTLLEGSWPYEREQPDLVVLGVEPGCTPSTLPPVRIFLGTEEGQYRAERVFVWSILQVRDPSRVYEIHLMKNVAGFDRRGWRTGFTCYRFAIPDFARQLVRIERGLSPPVLEVGDLTPQRDLSDVRDVIAAYTLLMERGATGEAYNVGTGTSRSMAEVLDRLVALSGLKVEIRMRSDLLRPAEPSRMTVDASKLRRLGWSPRWTLDQTLADTLASWRALPAE